MAKILSVKEHSGRLGYKVRSKENEDTGAKQAYGYLIPYSKLDKQFILRWASSFVNMTEAQMETGFAALSEAMQYFVLNGHSVTLDGLGTFSFSTKTGLWDEKTKKWKSAGKDSMSAVSADDIRGLYVRFRPAAGLAQTLGSAKFFNVEATSFGYQEVNGELKP